MDVSHNTDINLLVNRASEVLPNNRYKEKRNIKEQCAKHLGKVMMMENNNVISGGDLCSPVRRVIYKWSAFCMEPNPRRIHSWGEVRSSLPSGLGEEGVKMLSLASEKAQTAGSGAGVAVTARSSFPG